MKYSILLIALAAGLATVQGLAMPNRLARLNAERQSLEYSHPSNGAGNKRQSAPSDGAGNKRQSVPSNGVGNKKRIAPVRAVPDPRTGDDA